MGTEHTPGPWEVYTGHDGQFKRNPKILAQLYDRLAGPAEVVAHTCEVSRFDSEGHPFGLGWEAAEANARLIAAAPDMLAALEDISTWLVSPSADPGTFEHFQQIARAAIDAAKGAPS